MQQQIIASNSEFVNNYKTTAMQDSLQFGTSYFPFGVMQPLQSLMTPQTALIVQKFILIIRVAGNINNIIAGTCHIESTQFQRLKTAQ